jgi:imidazole glycerol-phosphate synthase subunit HisH
MVGIIDYGMGNLLSVFNAVEYLGAEAKICHKPEEIEQCERIILPGVGAFEECMCNLRDLNLINSLNYFAFNKKKPVLGICLGMQAMAKKSYEFGEHTGLGWFDAEVTRIIPIDSTLRVPHVGWNEIIYKNDSPLFRGLPEHPDFYFVHSYFMKCKDYHDVDATVEYGATITAAVRKENIFATQFHPEKSQDYGLKIIENFLKWLK